MMCDRCSQPIRPGQSYDKWTPDVGSGAAATVTLHRGGCRPTQRQRAPEPPVVLDAQIPRSRQRRRPRR
jgi:hypothetical protein